MQNTQKIAAIKTPGVLLSIWGWKKVVFDGRMDVK